MEVNRGGSTEPFSPGGIGFNASRDIQANDAGTPSRSGGADNTAVVISWRTRIQGAVRTSYEQEPCIDFSLLLVHNPGDSAFIDVAGTHGVLLLVQDQERTPV